ncbi:MAG: tetratricopeptide repeat protein [Campylobacterota bacterium]|nr:tetratricopeptide repeat protein [Campylobacterota bacterium]
MSQKAQKLFEKAIGAHKKGELINAKKYYEKLLKLYPTHAITLHNLATIYQGVNNFVEAEKLYKKAIYNKPDYFDAYRNLAILYGNNTKNKEAIEYYQKALALNPNDFQLYLNLGNIYKQEKKPIQAIEAYQKSLAITPNNYQVYNNLGNLYKQQDKIEKALECYHKSMSLNQNEYQVYVNIANLYNKQDKLLEALTYYQKAYTLMPNSFDLLLSMANTYYMQKDFAQSIIYYEKALTINPSHIETWNTIGVVYKDEENYNQAKECLQKAIELNPEYAEAYYNMGTLFKLQNNLSEAKKYLQQATLYDGEFIEAKWNLTLVYLVEKNYQEGFKRYHYRYHTNHPSQNTRIPNINKLLKSIENIQNRTILITKEQGLGDLIQFIRFVPYLPIHNSYIVEVPPSLVKLFSYSYPNITFVSDIKDIEFDYNFPLMDSAYLLDTTYDTLPNSKRYLSVNGNDSKAIKDKCNFQNDKLKIAINYQGSKTHTNDHNRSIPLEQLLLYLQNSPQIQLYSLQFERTQEEDRLLKENNIINFGKEAKDFYDTACFIDNMDLVISVDTSVAHLSAAMGKKTVILLPFAPDWRWGLDDSKTNWYESVTLFRQQKRGSWDEPLEEIVKQLNALVL